jgi:hypothetical protein
VDLLTYYWRHCLFCRETRRIQSLLFKELKSLVSRKEGRSRGKNQGNNKTDTASSSSSSSSSCRWKGIRFDREASLLRIERTAFRNWGKKKLIGKK